MSKRPVLIDLEESTDAQLGPEDAPPVPDLDAAERLEGRAMQSVAAFAGRRPSRLARLGWSLALLLLSTILAVSAWDFAVSFLTRAPLFGYAVVGVLIALGAVILIVAANELSAFSRLRRLDRLKQEVVSAAADNDLNRAKQAVGKLERLYSHRKDLRWGRERLAEQRRDAVEATDLFALAEVELLRPLDQAAVQEIEAGARQVAMVTALVPLALADVVAALTVNLRMMRRVAEIYGGRSGTLGSWRLARAVLAHMVATGAVAVGDDLISSVAGGGLVSKLSRRFGEGLVNGALTARVGVAAMEVCRPMPFTVERRPSVTRLVQGALTGLFQKS